VRRAPRDERFLARPNRAIWLGAALLALFALAALLVPAQPLALDDRWAGWMRDVATPALEHLALAFDWLGRGLGRALSLAAVALVLVVARRWLALLAFAAAETLAPLVSSLTKQLVDRPRPPGGLVHPSGASFPSGHATYAGVTSVALVLLFTEPGPRRRLWWALAALATAGMAWSRTYLRVHWLSDVLAGSLLGVAVALVVFALAQRLAGGG
jgi:membrane-associated phospholipid phosphatase